MSLSANANASQIANVSNPELFQLVYISQITPFGLTQPAVLSDILATSIKHNQKNNITGIICYGNGCFFQCIEGSEKALTNLKNLLIIDLRHTKINILDFSKIDERRFSKWVMWLSIIEKDLFSNMSENITASFHPERWKDDEWLEFIEKLHYNYLRYALPPQPDSLELSPTKKRITLYRLLREHQSFINIQALIFVVLLFFMFIVLSIN